MDPQMALPRALLLLLLLQLSPLGGRSHPMGGPGPAMELSKVQVSTARLYKPLGPGGPGSRSEWVSAYCHKRSSPSLGNQKVVRREPGGRFTREPSRVVGLRFGLPNLRHPHPSQKLLGHQQDTVSEQEEQMAPKPHQQDSGSVEDGEAKRGDSIGSLGPSDFQAKQRREVTTMRPGSSCFGQKMDRINTISRLGCNVVEN